MEPMTILIVDDEQAFTEILAQRLDKRGFVVKTAHHGGTALKWLQDDDKIEVVVLDIAMPDMNGIETLKTMKRDYPLVEIIMLTGQGAVDTAIEAIKLGAYNYFLKPCEFEDLVVYIQEAVQRKRHREAKILEVRMRPYISPKKREEMIHAILTGD
jgi:DNA-binding NtrC family response regulator